MSTTVGPGGIPSLGPLPDFTSGNTLFPSLLATVLLCGILTTLFTAARLTTKRLISSYGVEDCKFETNHLTRIIPADRKRLDFLMLAWVTVHFTKALRFQQLQNIWLTSRRFFIQVTLC